MNITRLSDGFAADIEGVDLAVLDGPAFAALHAAWLEHLVVRVRGQHLDDDALQRFSARFGPLEYRPMGKVTQAHCAVSASGSGPRHSATPRRFRS